MVREEDQFPQFPWPPPQASSMALLPNSVFLPAAADTVLLAHVDTTLTTALNSCGYYDKSYFAVPDGFALVTRLEQINSDGTPKSGEERWAPEKGPVGLFDLKGYLKALFTADPGHFRIIVFIVTPHPFSQDSATVSRDEAMAWLRQGLNRLPAEIGRIAYSPAFSSTALIYEFEKSQGDPEAKMLVPGMFTGRGHLEKSRIWQALGGI